MPQFQSLYFYFKEVPICILSVKHLTQNCLILWLFSNVITLKYCCYYFISSINNYGIISNCLSYTQDFTEREYPFRHLITSILVCLQFELGRKRKSLFEKKKPCLSNFHYIENLLISVQHLFICCFLKTSRNEEINDRILNTAEDLQKNLNQSRKYDLYKRGNQPEYLTKQSRKVIDKR